jgi:hypothetical protein
MPIDSQGPGWSVERSESSKRLPIVSVIESYGLEGFRAKGDNRAMAVCPYNDRNPSLNIDGNATQSAFRVELVASLTFVKSSQIKGQERVVLKLCAMSVVSLVTEILTGSTSSSGGPE